MDSNPQLVFEATEHLRDRMAQRKLPKRLLIYIDFHTTLDFLYCYLLDQPHLWYQCSHYLSVDTSVVFVSSSCRLWSSSRSRLPQHWPMEWPSWTGLWTYHLVSASPTSGSKETIYKLWILSSTSFFTKESWLLTKLRKLIIM